MYIFIFILKISVTIQIQALALKFQHKQESMFEDLGKRVNLDNMDKVRKLNAKTRYMQQNPDDDYVSPVRNSSHSDQSLDELNIQFRERQDNFRRIQLLQQQPNEFIQRVDFLPPTFAKRLENQIQLLHQKIEAERVQFERKYAYQQDLYKRREQWFKMESNKLKVELKKNQNCQQQLRQLKRILLSSQSVKQIIQSRIEAVEEENKSLKSQIHKYENQKINKNMHQIQIQLSQPNNQIQSNSSHKDWKSLLNKVKCLQEDVQYQKKQNEEKKKKIDKLHLQIQGYKNKVKQLQNQRQEYLQMEQDRITKNEQKLQQQIESLKKRNEYLQSTFIEKITQVTKLQAQLLSQNSQSYHSMQRIKDETLNLQEQSPIKEQTRKKEHSQRKYPYSSNGKKNFFNKYQKSENNPELIDRKSIGECRCCGKKVDKYKEKLKEANKTIMGLIQQKIRCVSITEPKHEERSANMEIKTVQEVKERRKNIRN